MKKTLFTLLALAGIAGAAEYVYTGDSNAWLEVAGNWKNTTTNTPLSGGDTYGNLSATQTAGNTFTVEAGTVAKGGKMCHFSNATLDIESNAQVSITGAQQAWTNTQVNVASGATLTYGAQSNLSGVNIDVASGGSLNITAKVQLNGGSITAHGDDVSITSTVSDIKMKNYTLNILSGKVTFGKTWFDAGSNSNGINFNLGEGASVAFTTSVIKADWTTAITLSTTFSEGYVNNGTGDVILGEQVLINFGTRDANSNTTLSDYLTSGIFVGNSITLNDTALTQGSFDADALTSEDVGKYKFVVEGNTLKVQYAAYSQMIPEPTTATLSLLALAGLAARRRRK